QLAEREGLGSVKMPIPELIAEMQPVLPAINGQPEPDPNFVGGSDRLTYRIPLASLPDQPASVKATLYYQAIPPLYLQDRFCTTGNQPDTERFYAMAGYLQLDGTQAAHWKLALVSSGRRVAHEVSMHYTTSPNDQSSRNGRQLRAFRSLLGAPEALPSPILRRMSGTRLFDGLTDFDQIFYSVHYPPKYGLRCQIRP